MNALNANDLEQHERFLHPRPVHPAIAEHLLEQEATRQAPAREATGFDRIAGQADLYGLRKERHEGWLVCLCADGRHDVRDYASEVFPTEDEADREHDRVAASHVLRLRRMVLTAAPEVIA